MRVLLVGLAVAAVLAPAAMAAPAPDAHDRALMAHLEAKVAQYEGLGSNSSSDLDALMSRCGLDQKDPSKAFKVVFTLLPLAVIELVQQYRGPFTDIRQTLETMHPHNALFRSWVAAELRDLTFLLQLDNGNTKIDECNAARVLLLPRPTAAQIKSTLGIEPAVLAQLVERSTTGQTTDLKRLNPPMRRFLLAGGVSAKHAAALTS